MSQVDPRALELIHAELDGELDAAQRAELEAIVAADPAARDYRDQWRRISGALSRLPEIEPPAGLGRRWQGQAPAAPIRIRSTRPRWLRPAIGLAAGGMALALALGYGGLGRQMLDADSMVGTMGGEHAAGARRIPVDVDGVTGAIALLPSASGWTLDFNLRSERPAPVTATWDSAAISVGEVRGTPSKGGLESGPGRIAFVVDPAQHLSIDLRAGEGGQVRIRIQGQEGDGRDLAITIPPAPADR
jgi:hypothetical protein